MTRVILGLLFASGIVAAFWPKARLEHRRGSVYQRNFDEFFVVGWAFGLFHINVKYVVTRGQLFVVDSHNLSLAGLGRQASHYEGRIIAGLLNEDLHDFTVARVLDDDQVMIRTLCGALFDLEREDDVWTYRHNGHELGTPYLNQRLGRETLRYRLGHVVTRSSRNASSV
jgi:hypothetical protein